MPRFLVSPGIRYRLIMAGLLAALLLIVLLKTCITLDAYITFRVVDNAVNGYGLRWNVGERVQVYTHPLWMLLHIPFYALWDNIFYITIALSLLCTAVAVAVTIATFRKSWPLTLAMLIMPLCISRSFTESSILGLENPLLHALFALFGWALLKAPERKFWFWLTFFCSLSLMTRMDTGLIYLPLMSYLFIFRFRSIRFGQCVLGSVPIISWIAFSLFYYGFLFPNTKYAKFPSKLFDPDFILQGFHYLLNLLVLDITSAQCMIGVALVLPICWLCLTSMRRAVRIEMLCLALGMLLYDLYVIAIGGTYISGRLWSLQIFMAFWIIYGLAADKLQVKLCMMLAGMLMLVKLCYPSYATLEKAFPVCFEGGMVPQWWGIPLNGRVPVAGHSDRKWVSVFPGVSLYSFQTGPGLTAINPFAFTDPLLARLPPYGAPVWRSYLYHLYHKIPEGYQYALETGSLDKMDPDLAQYYDKLRTITSGDLWSLSRLEEIIKFNRGDYDYLRDRYVERIRQNEAKPESIK